MTTQAFHPNSPDHYMSATKHLNELDDAIAVSRIGGASTLHALVSAARKEVQAAEAAHAALEHQHAELQKAHATLKEEHAKLQRAQSVKGPTIIDNRSPAMDDEDTLLR